MSFLDDDASISGLSAEQIIEAMKGPSANGTATLDAATQAHSVVHGGHVELETMTKALIGTMTAAWRGDAADLAHSRIQPMVKTLQLSQDDLARAKDLTSRQSGSFHDAANALVPVPPKPSNNVLNVLTPWHTDLDSQIDRWNEAQSRNIAIYTSYTSASSYNHDGMPTTYGDVSRIGSPANVRITSPDQGHEPETGTGSGPGGLVGHGPSIGGGPGTGSSPGGGNGPGAGGGLAAGGPNGTSGPSGTTGTSAGSSGGTGGSGVGGQQGQLPPGTGGQPTPVVPSGPTSTQGYQDIPTQPTGPQWNQLGYNPAPDAVQPGSGDVFATGGTAFGASGSARTPGSPSTGQPGLGRSAQPTPGRTVQPAPGRTVQPGPGSRAGVGGMAGEPRTPLMGRPGAAGSNGMPGPVGQAGKKEEDKEHKSAAYLEDDYSDEIVGELPRTTPPVIGLD